LFSGPGRGEEAEGSKRKGGQAVSLEIVIASLPDRDGVAVELWQGQELLGEVTSEGGEPNVTLYPRRDGRPWAISLSDLETWFRRARGELSDLSKA
jgi:hypothetical protein